MTWRVCRISLTSLANSISRGARGARGADKPLDGILSARFRIAIMMKPVTKIPAQVEKRIACSDMEENIVFLGSMATPPAFPAFLSPIVGD